MENGPEVVEDAKVDYTSFADLTNFEEEKDMAPILERIINTPQTEWKEHYFAVDDLRRLNKFHFAFLAANLPAAHDFIIASIDSLRSNIAKNALIFAQELYSTECDPMLLSATSAVLVPALAIKSNYEKTFIAKEAIKAYKSVAKSSVCPESAFGFIEGSKSKNYKIAELSMSLLEEHIDSASPAYLAQPNNVRQVIAHAGIELDGKRAKNQKTAQSLLSKLKKAVGDACFEELLSACEIDEEAQKRIRDSFVKKKARTEPKGGLRAFMAEKKKATETGGDDLMAVEEEPPK